MKSIHLDVDEATLAKIEKVAADMNTSVASLLNDYVRQLTSLPNGREAARRELLQLSKSKGEIGPRTWTRDNLHER